MANSTAAHWLCGNHPIGPIDGSTMSLTHCVVNAATSPIYVFFGVCFIVRLRWLYQMPQVLRQRKTTAEAIAHDRVHEYISNFVVLLLSCVARLVNFLPTLVQPKENRHNPCCMTRAKTTSTRPKTSNRCVQQGLLRYDGSSRAARVQLAPREGTVGDYKFLV